MESMPRVVRSFLSYKETIQGRSPQTAAKYASDLGIFFRFLLVSRGEKPQSDWDHMDLSGVDEAFLKTITPDEIYAFLLWCAHDQNNKPAARARKLSAVKSFFKYHTTKSRTLDKDPTLNIDSPAVKQALPKYLSLDESLALLESVPSDRPTSKRDYCILTLFLNCGMRLSELVGINLTDISSDYRKLVVTGKGSKQRTVYLNDACRDAIQEYLSVRETIGRRDGHPIKDKNALFLSERGNRISDKTVQWLVKRQLREAGLEGKGYSTHKLRHTAATLMYNNGNVDIRVLKDILGHEQLT
ncbi:MAG: tyrosine-type recombinase/integrase, partial [Clostridia bacterium]|nr:tyrosine-type recombinase/integrase [Clostridia bacterium]